MDTDGRFPTPTTRRAVVRTGAKLAYAMPVVAASFKGGSAAAACPAQRAPAARRRGLRLRAGAAWPHWIRRSWPDEPARPGLMGEPGR